MSESKRPKVGEEGFRLEPPRKPASPKAFAQYLKTSVHHYSPGHVLLGDIINNILERLEDLERKGKKT